MKLGEIYRVLCNIYGLESDIDIDEYLVNVEYRGDDIIVGNRMGGREALLIKNSGDMTELGLFIAPEILDVLEHSSPLASPDEFACAAEGVSHFVYAYDRISQNKNMTKLELELQGEVDKFIVLSLAASKVRGSVSLKFFNMQFEDHRFDPALGENECRRYAEASRLAAKFCHHLLVRCFNPLSLSELLPAARNFFVRDLSGKIAMLTP